MKKSQALTSLIGLALSMDAGFNIPSMDEPKETKEERQKRLKKVEELNKLKLEKVKTQQNINKGLTKFFYGENNLWALNQKTADTKAKKKGWI